MLTLSLGLIVPQCFLACTKRWFTLGLDIQKQWHRIECQHEETDLDFTPMCRNGCHDYSRTKLQRQRPSFSRSDW